MFSCIIPCYNQNINRAEKPNRKRGEGSLNGVLERDTGCEKAGALLQAKGWGGRRDTNRHIGTPEGERGPPPAGQNIFKKEGYFMDERKRTRYLNISKEVIGHLGGRENLTGVAHCATRLRVVLKDNEKADLEAIDRVDLVKGVFLAGDQVQIIFGSGLVNDVYEVFADHTGMKGQSLSDLKTEANQKMNPLQRILKGLSDVFIDIMPGILAAALLTGISGLLGNLAFVESNQTLFAINRIVNIASGAIFGFLPLVVAYSACKRFGGRPIMGLVLGCIMLSGSLTDASAAAQGTAAFETIRLLGIPVDLIGFQGGIIIALMMGWVVAKLDNFFEKHVPELVRLLVSPLLTTLCGAFLLFLVVGPAGRGLQSGITSLLVWCTNNLGVFGYALFSGVQQLIVITGLHHIFGAIESQLLADTGRNFLNSLMSVAMIAQGGAVLGLMLNRYSDKKSRELCGSSFVSILFGITEPALFGVNIRYKYPLVCGCLGGAIGGALVYLFDLAALGFGTTVVPGIAICDPANGGYVKYIAAHLTALGAGFLFTVLYGKAVAKEKVEAIPAAAAGAPVRTAAAPVPATFTELRVASPVKGAVKDIADSVDQTFASKVLGEGIAVDVADGGIVAPADGTVTLVYPTGHAIGLELEEGVNVLIHCGVDTVKLEGKGFQTLVKEGQRVRKGDPLLKMDLPTVEKAGYPTQTMMVFELDDDKTVEITPGQAQAAIVRAR